MIARGISRRTIAKGAAWSVPAIMLASPAMAIAASQTTLGATICGLQFEQGTMDAIPTTISLGIPENVGEALVSGSTMTWTFHSEQGMPMPGITNASSKYDFTAERINATTVVATFVVKEGQEVLPSRVVCGIAYPELQLKFGVQPTQEDTETVFGTALTPGQRISVTSGVVATHRATIEDATFVFDVPRKTDNADDTLPTVMVSRSGAQTYYPWVRHAGQGLSTTADGCGVGGNGTSVTYPSGKCRTYPVAPRNYSTLSAIEG